MKEAPAPGRYSRLDVYESMKEHAFARVPALAEEAGRYGGWQHLSVPEVQLLALMVFLDLDPENAPLRRRARRLMSSLLPGGRDGAMTARESAADWDGQVDAVQRARLASVLEWLAENPLIPALESAAGPRAAVRAVRRIPHISGLRAWRLLAAVGYPVLVPDAARLRLLYRLGWLEEETRNEHGREAALAVAEEIAREVGEDLTRLNSVLGVFSGAAASGKAAGPCLQTPRCPECPVSAQCGYYRQRRGELNRANRSLAVMTRREQRPRERLLKNGPEALSDADLLAIILRTGTGQLNAVDLANRLLVQAESLERLANMSVAEMCTLPGMGEVKAITVKASLELARRLRQESNSNVRTRISGARRVHEMLKDRFIGAKKEVFMTVNLNTKLEVVRTVPVSVGTLNQSLVHPREVFTEAVRDSAHAIIFVHNHPSGDPSPSREDHVVTKRLVECGRTLGINVLDHIIIGSDSYYSFADEGKLDL